MLRSQYVQGFVFLTMSWFTKGLGTRFQSPVLSQKHVRNVHHTHKYLIIHASILIVLRIQKK